MKKRNAIIASCMLLAALLGTYGGKKYKENKTKSEIKNVVIPRAQANLDELNRDCAAFQDSINKYTPFLGKYDMGKKYGRDAAVMPVLNRIAANVRVLAEQHQRALSNSDVEDYKLVRESGTVAEVRLPLRQVVREKSQLSKVVSASDGANELQFGRTFNVGQVIADDEWVNCIWDLAVQLEKSVRSVKESFNEAYQVSEDGASGFLYLTIERDGGIAHVNAIVKAMQTVLPDLRANPEIYDAKTVAALSRDLSELAKYIAGPAQQLDAQRKVENFTAAYQDTKQLADIAQGYVNALNQMVK